MERIFFLNKIYYVYEKIIERIMIAGYMFIGWTARPYTRIDTKKMARRKMERKKA